jgi:hypothetical protein
MILATSFQDCGMILATVIKPGPAWQVDLGSGRPDSWTDPGLIKDQLWQQPGQTRATRNPGDTEPG